MSGNKARYETKDIHFGAMAALIGILLVLLGGIVGITRFLDRLFSRGALLSEAPRSPMAQPQPLPPEPRLQVNPTVDLIRLRDVENVTLTNYAWVDGSAGKVRIPIARAMAILAQRGLPSRPVQEGDSE